MSTGADACAVSAVGDTAAPPVGDVVTLADAFNSAVHTGLAAITYSAGFFLNGNGTVQRSDGGNPIAQINGATDWLKPTGNEALYEVKYDLVSGPDLNGTTNMVDGVYASGLALPSNIFQRQNAGLVTTTVITLTIRRIADSVILATRNKSITVGQDN